MRCDRPVRRKGIKFYITELIISAYISSCFVYYVFTRDVERLRSEYPCKCNDIHIGIARDGGAGVAISESAIFSFDSGAPVQCINSFIKREEKSGIYQVTFFDMCLSLCTLKRFCLSLSSFDYGFLVKAATRVGRCAVLDVFRGDISSLTDAIIYSKGTLLDSATIEMGANLADCFLSTIDTFHSVGTGLL